MSVQLQPDVSNLFQGHLKKIFMDAQIPKMVTNLLIFIVFTLHLYTSNGSFILAAPSSDDLSAGQAKTLTPAEERPRNDEHSKALSRNPLNLRALGPIPIPNHWTIAIDSITAIVPNAPAIAILADFYAAVEAHAATVQNQLTDTAALVFQHGVLALDFECGFGQIPWSLVHNFALLMQEVTGRGLVGFYQARATHISGFTVFIGLQLPDIAAAGQ